MNDKYTPEDARTQEVDPNQCIWCKQPPTNPTHLDTGERICNQCLGDLREWKRTRYVDLLVSSDLEPGLRSLLLREWRDVRDTLAEIHDGGPKLKALPTRTSNSNDYRTHPNDSAGSDGS